MDPKQKGHGDFVVTLQLDIGQIVLGVEQVREFYFIEDIYSYCVTGQITFTDRQGIFEFGPLTGNERISIVYGENNDEEWTFDIFKTSRIERNNGGREGESGLIQLFFVDSMFYNLNFLHYSRSWKDEKISTIIDEMSTNMLSVDKWGQKETTEETLDFFYMPYWTPNKAITWLLKRSTGNRSKMPGFCFYNNSKGTNMVTLDTLLKQQKLLSINDKDDGLYVFVDENTILLNKILDWSISGMDSLSLKRISGGTGLGYNTLDKSFKIKENTYTDSLEKHTILGQKSLFPDYSEVKSNYINEVEDSTDKLNTMFNNVWIKLYNKQQIISITTRGHEERYCGAMIEIYWPSIDGVNSQYNKQLSGKYLIKSITHHFSGYNTPAYAQKMVLIKNGYEDCDLKTLVKSTKNNMAK